MYKPVLRHLAILFSLLTLIFVQACCPEDDTPEQPQTPHTLLYYFVGTDLSYYFGNNMSAAGKALAALTEAGGVLAEEENKSRVLCFIQRSKTSAEIIELKYADGLFEQEVLASYEVPKAMTSEQMSSYLKDMIELAPAVSYGLVMGGHSRAWTLVNSPDFYATTSDYGIGRPQIRRYWERDPEALVTRFFGEGYPFFSSYSEGASNFFDITDIASALSSTGVKFEYAIYDACFMSNIESLYDLRNNSKYAIASVSEVMGNGFPYDRIIPHLFKTNGKSFDLESVCYEFYDYYRTSAGYSGSVALTDCTELDALAAATKRVNNGSKNEVDNGDLQYYDGLNPHLFFDFGQYINALCADEATRTAFQTQLDKTIVCKYTLNSFYTGLKPYRGTHKIDTEVYSGVTTSQPSEMYRSEYESTAWYKATH